MTAPFRQSLELAAARFNSLMPFTYAARTGLNYDDLVTCVSEQANQIVTDAQVGDPDRAGRIDAVDSVNHTYRVTFDRNTLGTHSVSDIEVLVSRSYCL